MIRAGTRIWSWVEDSVFHQDKVENAFARHGYVGNWLHYRFHQAFDQLFLKPGSNTVLVETDYGHVFEFVRSTNPSSIAVFYSKINCHTISVDDLVWDLVMIFESLNGNKPVMRYED